MSSLIKSVVQLPIQSQICVYFFLLLIVLNIVLIKFVMKWWNRLFSRNLLQQEYQDIDKKEKKKNKSKNGWKRRQTQQVIHINIVTQFSTVSEILIRLLCTFSFLEPFMIRMSLNKLHLLICLSIWVTVLIYSDSFFSDIVHQTLFKEKFQNINFKSLTIYLGPVSFFIAIIDFVIRYLAFFCITKRRSEQEINEAQIKFRNPLKIKGALKILVIMYYFIMVLGCVMNSLFVINLIINSAMEKSDITKINFYYNIESSEKLQMVVISLMFLAIFHNVVIFVMILIIWVGSKWFSIQLCQEKQILWKYFLNVRDIYKDKKEKALNTRENLHESKQNLANNTFRNNIQRPCFEEENPTYQAFRRPYVSYGEAKIQQIKLKERGSIKSIKNERFKEEQITERLKNQRDKKLTIHQQKQKLEGSNVNVKYGWGRDMKRQKQKLQSEIGRKYSLRKSGQQKICDSFNSTEEKTAKRIGEMQTEKQIIKKDNKKKDEWKRWRDQQSSLKVHKGIEIKDLNEGAQPNQDREPSEKIIFKFNQSSEDSLKDIKATFLNTNILKIIPKQKKEKIQQNQNALKEEGKILKKVFKEDSILKTIENNCASQILNRKKKRKGQLRILWQENQGPDDCLDPASNYVVKDLGCIRSPQVETRLQRPKRFSTMTYTPTFRSPNREEKQQYSRKKNSCKAPSIHEFNIENSSFCVEDFNLKEK